MTKAEKIQAFDPNGVGIKGNNLFGLPFNFEESETVVLPVPWEVTVSYGTGTAAAPQQIFDASFQLDLHDIDYPDAWQKGIFMLDISEELQQKSNFLRDRAAEIIRLLEHGEDESNATIKENTRLINDGGEFLNKWVFENMTTLLNAAKFPVLLGGDHSCPLGFYQALALKHGDYGILQIDAHADLRNAYEGFKYSHASIMYNALQIESVKRLVQIGIRDLCREESDLIEQSNERIVCYYDQQIKEEAYRGKTWEQQCEEMLFHLPQKVHISFDIDGLDPKLCPGTGTPVPGGFEFHQIVYLIKKLKASGREIIGFDLVETGNSEFEGNVSARMLMKICHIIKS